MARRGPIPRTAEADRNSGRGPARRPRAPVVVIDRAAGPPAPPEDLGPRGRAAWQRFWTASWLIPADEIGVRILCQIIDALDIMETQIKAEGRTSRGSKNQPVPHPLLGAVHALRGSFLQWVGDYGFSPMSRVRMRIETVAKSEPTVLGKYTSEDPYTHLRGSKVDPRQRLNDDA